MILIRGRQTFSVKNTIISEDVRRYSRKLQRFLKGLEAMKVLLPYTLMLSSVSLFFQTSPGRGVAKLRPKEP